ncbi:MAG: hypothetical protein OEU50_14875 [Gammaproteobacteria bacterium]|nr:hypothetical protein [Gammaproteobacteria bacterium]
MANPESHPQSPVERLIAGLNAAFDWWLFELGEILRLALGFRKPNLARFEVTAGDEITAAEDDGAGAIGRRHISLQLDDNSFLYRKVKLPAAARKNIERVIGYEFNKYFPISAGDALFSCRAIPAAAAAASIEIEIWALSRKLIDGYLAMIKHNYDIEPRKLFIANRAGETLITRDVEREQRLASANERVRYSRALNFLIAGLLAALFVYPVVRMDAYLETQRQEISRLEKQAQPVIETRENIMALNQRFNELIDRRQEYPSRANVWSYITRAVADQAILDRIALNGHKVQLAGKSKSVERLLRSLEAEQRVGEVKIVGQMAETRDSLFEVLRLDIELKE